MKKIILILLAVSFTRCFSQTPYNYYFSAMRGMEDYSGNTHLFYTQYEAFKNPNYSEDNSVVTIYNLDLLKNTDSVFLKSGYSCNPIGCSGRTILDFEFWNNDTKKYIFCGDAGGMDPSPFIERYDGRAVHIAGAGFFIPNIEISKQNDSVLYYSSSAKLFKSTDNGINWINIADNFELARLSPYNDNVLLGKSREGSLLKSVDGGKSSFVADTAHFDHDDLYKVFYDKDSSYIYRVSGKSLYVSSKAGDSYSFIKTYTGTQKLYLSVDEKTSGRIFIADGRNLLVSDNHGADFRQFNTLDRSIIGIYAKPGKEVVYAATKYNIFEVSPDTVKTIKTLRVPPDILKYYPLAKGNKWFYSYLDWPANFPPVYYSSMVKECIKDTVMQTNGKKYFFIRQAEPYPSKNYTYFFERIDSVTGKVYRFLYAGNQTEVLIDDLAASFGDTVTSYRFYPYQPPPTAFITEDIVEKWGKTFQRKQFESDYLMSWRYDFLKGIGISQIVNGYDFGRITYDLKGCIIDQVVYGDTVLTGISDKPVIAHNFQLYQNYPNPFNPNTIIKYEIPYECFVSLRVYNALGDEVAALVEENQSAGIHEIIFPKNSSKLRLSSGIYFYILKAAGHKEVRKMLIVK